jgi:hypothetical protein
MRRQIALALAGFSLLTLAVFRPTAYELAHTTPAINGDASDALFLMWATSHVSRALFTDPLHLFDAGIFHPLRRTLAFGDHMIGQALAGLPVWLATHNPLLEYNVLSLASYALGATAMFAYVRVAAGSSVASAAAAGLVFAFTPYRFDSPLWLQVLCTFFMPLALLFWMRFVDALRWRDWALWVGCWVAHSLMGMYLALYFAVTMTCLAALALVSAPTRRAPRLWLGTLLGPVVALALLTPVLWPYVALRAEQGQVRTLGLDTALTFFLPGPGTLSGLLFGSVRSSRLGPGLIAWGLAAVGLLAGAWTLRGRSSMRRFVWTAHALGLAVTLLLVLTPIRLQLALPGFDVLRNTNRAFFVSLVFLAAFAAEGVDWLGRRRAVAALLVALLALDMGTPTRERRPMPVGDEVPAVYRWLAALPPDEVIYDGTEMVQHHPPLALLHAAQALYYAIFHGQRLALGYSGFAGAGGAYVSMQLGRFPDPEALRLFRTLGVGHVVWRLPNSAAVERFLARLPAGEVEVAARFENDVALRIVGAPAPPPVSADVHALPRTEWRLETRAGADPEALRDGERSSVARIGKPAGREPPTLTVDLGRTWPVAGVRAVPPEPNAPGIYLADVELSVNGMDWQTAPGWFHPDSLATLLHRPRALDHYEARFPTTWARYVRLAARGMSTFAWPMEIAELEILGDCTAGAIPGCPPR